MAHNSISLSNPQFYMDLSSTGKLVTSGDISSSIGFNSSTAGLSTSEIAELKDDSGLLYALIDAGVEEWDGYDKAIALWRERRGN